MMDSKFQMIAKTLRGLEDVLCDELTGLGAEDVEAGTRMVSFRGDKALLYKANVSLRTALRVLKPIAKFEAADTDELYDYVREFDWEQFIGPDSTFSVDSTVNSAEFNHSKYVTYRVKDGIADHFTDKYGHRPSIRLTGADMQLNVHIQDRWVTISLDSSGEPLSKRGYRQEQTEAPINEVLAAGIIMKTGWHGEKDFADPMCGSGTFLIEAALIAGNINPGIYRQEFAFEKWPDFDSELFESIYEDDSEERDIRCAIMGGDISPEAVSIARRNIKAAHMEKHIQIVCRPMQEWEENDRDGVLVTNPPYGERLHLDDIKQLYREIGSTLKNHFQGWQAWILGYKDEHFDEIGLRPSVKFPILNGALECSLREYVMFGGSYRDFKTEGGKISNEDFNREVRPRKRHVEDRSEFKRDDRKKDFKKREFKRDDRKRDFDRDDRKKDFKKRDFKRDDRKRDFDRDDRKRDFKRDDRKRDFKKKDFKREERKVIDRGPKLGADRMTYENPVYMRRRKPRPTDEPEEFDNND